MPREIYRKIIALVVKASNLAQTIGIANLLQPGLAKEMIIADILCHEQSTPNVMLTPMHRVILLGSMSTCHVKKGAAVNLTECSKPHLISARNR